MYQKSGKRILDLLIAAAGMIILLPLFVLLLLPICVDIRGNPFFVQERAGYHGKLFRIFKLRTIRDDGRISSFGRLLRVTGLDEIPQLLNVLQGEMSIVGPRPLLSKYLILYNEHQNLRHNVRPGITGLAQVNGRNAIGWEEKFAYDIQYAESISFMLDAQILLKTVANAFDRNQAGIEIPHISEEFKGN